jgi:Ca2+-binding RTX toxin-like protein
MPKNGPKKAVFTSTLGLDNTWTHEGTSGNDRFSVSETQSTAVNVINGNTGNDRLTGGLLGDTINGGTGNDWVFGGAGNDILSGNEGNDHISGGMGADLIAGGLGNDFLTGGTEVDTFVFAKGGGKDTVLDFDADLEKIQFDNFTGLSASALMASVVIDGTNAIIDTGDGRIHLKNFTGTLDAGDFLGLA